MENTQNVYSGIDRIPKGNAPDTITEGCLVLEGGVFAAPLLAPAADHAGFHKGDHILILGQQTAFPDLLNMPEHLCK